MALDDEPQLYHDLMRFRPDDLTPNGWAVKAGVSRTFWSDLRRHGNPSRRTLEKLLSAAGSSLAEFEALRVGGARGLPSGPGSAAVGEASAAPWRTAPLPAIPLLATATGGEWGDPILRIELTILDQNEVVDQIARPVSLAGDRDAYALTIVGATMWPRFRAGRRIIVSPRSSAAIGDDVVVRLKNVPNGDSLQARVLVKELARRTADFVELRQFNPDASFRIDASTIAAIHKIAGEAV